jgi:uncharacterized Zn-binding protein involved in type VI secretion
MSDAARQTDMCSHAGTLVTTGSPDTTTGFLPQARLGDLTSPCVACKMPLPGRIVQGSSTVFVNKVPAARARDQVVCGLGIPPSPPGGFHLPASSYSVRPEDDYVSAVFTDDGTLIDEPPPEAPAEDVPDKKPLTRFLQGLSLDLRIGLRFGLALTLAGPNKIQMGCSSVHIGG